MTRIDRLVVLTVAWCVKWYHKEAVSQDAVIRQCSSLNFLQSRQKSGSSDRGFSKETTNRKIGACLIPERIPVDRLGSCWREVLQEYLSHYHLPAHQSLPSDVSPDPGGPRLSELDFSSDPCEIARYYERNSSCKLNPRTTMPCLVLLAEVGRRWFSVVKAWFRTTIK